MSGGTGGLDRAPAGPGRDGPAAGGLADLTGAAVFGGTRWPAGFDVPPTVLVFPQPPAAGLVDTAALNEALGAPMHVLGVRARALAPDPLPLADAVANLLARSADGRNGTAAA